MDQNNKPDTIKNIPICKPSKFKNQSVIQDNNKNIRIRKINNRFHNPNLDLLLKSDEYLNLRNDILNGDD